MPEHSELSMDSPVSARVIREAAKWLVRLREPDVSAREREAWECWRIQSAEHQRAWRLAESLGRKFEGIPSELGMSVLGRREGAVSRRAALKAMGWLLAIGPAGWLAAELPWPVWRSDFRTATGEQRHVTLADGTNMTLNTASAVDVAFDGAQRLVRLVAGEVLISTAPDPSTSARPFLVQTAQGSLRALGTRFDVRVDEARTSVAVLEGAVQVMPAGLSRTRLIVPAGQRTAFTASAIAGLLPASDKSALWSQGILFADHMRLADFLAELGRYRQGVIHCDPLIADLRVSGSFQLDNTDRVLALLADTFPLRITTTTRYWVSVDPA
jgi:transmembrane sensor